MGDKSGSKKKKDKKVEEDQLDISNHNFDGRPDGADLKTQLKLVKKLTCLGGGPLHGFSSDDSVSERTDRTEKTFPMDESFSSDMDSLSPKSVETKDSKKSKKKKEKKSKAEGKTKDKKKRR